MIDQVLAGRSDLSLDNVSKIENARNVILIKSSKKLKLIFAIVLLLLIILYKKDLRDWLASWESSPDL